MNSQRIDLFKLLHKPLGQMFQKMFLKRFKNIPWKREILQKSSIDSPEIFQKSSKNPPKILQKSSKNPLKIL